MLFGVYSLIEGFWAILAARAVLTPSWATIRSRALVVTTPDQVSYTGLRGNCLTATTLSTNLTDYEVLDPPSRAADDAKPTECVPTLQIPLKKLYKCPYQGLIGTPLDMRPCSGAGSL